MLFRSRLGQRVSLAKALTWKEAGAVEVLRERDLESRLHVLVNVPFRGEVALATWVPEVRGDPAEAERLLLMVPHLESLTVAIWAKEAGRSERSFRMHCRALFARTPHEILWSFIDASFRAGRREGRSHEELAWALDFFDVANLRRAYRRRGMAFPG